jgi:hypothetical protein
MKIENEQKVCESCGEEFPCGANSEDCWCFSEIIEPKSLEMIAKEFSNCLCPICLTAKRNKNEIEI